MSKKRKEGREFAKGILDVLAFVFIAVLVCGWIIGTFVMPVDDSDFDRFNRSGLRIHTDAKTGVQYLSNSKGGMVRRESERFSTVNARQ